MNIPLKDNSVPVYTSNIGLSSTRNGKEGKDRALSEIYRTLVKGGLFFSIENEWNNINTILEVFDAMNWEPWIEFSSPQPTWHDRFIEHNFEIISEESMGYYKLSSDDNELGEAAERLGFDIGVKSTAFILRKR